MTGLCNRRRISRDNEFVLLFNISLELGLNLKQDFRDNVIRPA